MKKVTILMASAICFTLVSCNGENEENKEGDKSKKEKTEETVSEETEEAPKEETKNYDPYTKEKLQGEWEVVDAQAYSKDKMIGQTYVFEGDSATYYAGFGQKGMITGTIKIEDSKLSLTYTDKTDKGTSTVTSTYEGGFEGDMLYMNKMDAKITLKKK